MNTQNEVAEWILAQLPGSRLIKRPKQAPTAAGQPTRWEGRIATAEGELQTVVVLATTPPTLSATPYQGYQAE